MDEISRSDRRRLAIQRLASYLFFPIVSLAGLFWLRIVKRLTLRNPREIRDRFASLIGPARGPVLVCSNHLTLVDTLILIWALAPLGTYVRRYSLFPWSVPEKANFSRTPFWRIASFLGKCVYVTRGGPREEVRRTLGKITYLLRSGELVSIFPEGGRSRTGRVDVENFAYGVGQILLAVPDARVLLVYLRGRKQDGYTDFPHTGDTMTVDLEMLEPRTASTGLRGARDLATQIVHGLAAMEERYFKNSEFRDPPR